MSTLLPCPFCGGTNLSVVEWVECDDCGVMGPGPLGVVSGVKRWNTRPAPTLAARLAEAVGLLREWDGDADPRDDKHEEWKTDWLDRREKFLDAIDAESAK